MRKLFRPIVKLKASMSTHPHYHLDDTSRPYRDIIPLPDSRPRETVGSHVTATPEPLSSARDTTYPTSQIRNENAPSRSLSQSHVPQDAPERVDVERDGGEHQKTPPTLTKDQESMYARDREVTETRDELQSRPPKEEDQYMYDGDRTDDKRDAPHEAHYPTSPKESIDIHRPPLARVRDAEPIAPKSSDFQYHCDAQRREVSIIRRQRRATNEEDDKYYHAYVSARQQCEERSKKITSIRQQRQEALAERNKFACAHAAVLQRYEEQAKELDAMRHERQAALEKKQKVEEYCASLRQKYGDLSDRHDGLRHKYQSTKANLEQRMSELQGAQKFLTTADTYSGSEVVNTLRKLNEEVQQSATYMTEWAVEKFMVETLPTSQMTTQAIEQTRTSEALGMRFMQLLGTRKRKDNFILVEIAFQAYLTHELYHIASTWSIGQEQSRNTYIHAIYQRLRDGEVQAISGNWRALTRRYALAACTSDPELGGNLTGAIITGFSDILSAAGSTTSASDIVSGLWSKFAAKLHQFVSLAVQVNNMIGVGVVSEDLEVVKVSPDTVFDEKTMEDSYENEDSVQGTEGHLETVLCATELGLVRRIRAGAGKEQDGKPSELIIKPKVALMSVISIVDE